LRQMLGKHCPSWGDGQPDSSVRPQPQMLRERASERSKISFTEYLDLIFRKQSLDWSEICAFRGHGECELQRATLGHRRDPHSWTSATRITIFDANGPSAIHFLPVWQDRELQWWYGRTGTMAFSSRIPIPNIWPGKLQSLALTKHELIRQQQETEGRSSSRNTCLVLINMNVYHRQNTESDMRIHA
jgi:hypothetical protein